MNVLDPLEVAEIEMWPFWDLENKPKPDTIQVLKSAEYTVFQNLLSTSKFHAVLNEIPVAPAPLIELPASVRTRIVPDDIFERLRHPDSRIARRALTIARLAQVISERSVQSGIRQTLLTQARRLEDLAARRLAEFSNDSNLEDPD